MSTNRPLLTQREAATACGVSRSTIRRRREAGDLPGSVLDEERGWLVPVEDLLAAGLRLNAPAPPDSPREHGPAAVADASAQVASEVAALRAELEEHRHARELAELEAAHLRERLEERGEHIETLRQALTALTAAPERSAIPQPTAPSEPPAVPAATTPNASEEKRRWFRRG